MRFLWTLPVLACLAFLPGEPHVVKKIKTQYKSAEIDVNGKVYLVDDKLNLCLYKQQVDTPKRFSVSNYGIEPMIDASNPLEIFIFFPATGKVVVFDNQLNVQLELNVYGENYIQPLAFGRANDGNIWLLDNNSMTMKKISRQGDVLNESVILKNFTPSAEIRRVFDDGTMVVVQDANHWVYHFNQNLLLENTFNGEGRLVGIEEAEMWIAKDKQILGLHKPFGRALFSDTLSIGRDSLQVLKVNHGYILESADSTLILRSRN